MNGAVVISFLRDTLYLYGHSFEARKYKLALFFKIMRNLKFQRSFACFSLFILAFIYEELK